MFSPNYQEREEEERLKAQLQVEQQKSLTSSDKTTEPSTFERNDSLLDKGLPNCTCIYTTNVYMYVYIYIHYVIIIIIYYIPGML